MPRILQIHRERLPQLLRRRIVAGHEVVHGRARAACGRGRSGSRRGAPPPVQLDRALESPSSRATYPAGQRPHVLHHVVSVARDPEHFGEERAGLQRVPTVLIDVRRAVQRAGFLCTQLVLACERERLELQSPRPGRCARRMTARAPRRDTSSREAPDSLSCPVPEATSTNACAATRHWPRSRGTAARLQRISQFTRAVTRRLVDSPRLFETLFGVVEHCAREVGQPDAAMAPARSIGPNTDVGARSVEHPARSFAASSQSDPGLLSAEIFTSASASTYCARASPSESGTGNERNPPPRVAPPREIPASRRGSRTAVRLDQSRLRRQRRDRPRVSSRAIARSISASAEPVMASARWLASVPAVQWRYAATSGSLESSPRSAARASRCARERWIPADR